MTILTSTAIALTLSTSLIATLMAGVAKADQSPAAAADTLIAENDKQNLHNNKCLKKLKDSDKIVVSAAFHDGASGFRQLQELLDREPWGYVADPIMQQELDTLVKQLSPFLIVTLTKKQALLLESHRDLIKWILIQSTEKTCA